MCIRRISNIRRNVLLLILYDRRVESRNKPRVLESKDPWMQTEGGGLRIRESAKPIKERKIYGTDAKINSGEL